MQIELPKIDRRHKKLEGCVYGNLVVIRWLGFEQPGSRSIYECECKLCGELVPVRAQSLPERTDCGKHRESNAIDLTGRVFERLTVIKRAPNKGKGRLTVAYWVCACACGNTIVTRGAALLNGNTKSCGCLGYERKFVGLSQYYQRLRTSKGASDPSRKMTPTVQLKRTEAIRQGFNRRVMEADAFTCQLCGRIGGTLNVHHLDKVSDDPDALTRIEDCVTLCGWDTKTGVDYSTCHARIHQKNFNGPVDPELTKLLRQRIRSSRSIESAAS